MASGNTLLTWTPQCNEPPATIAATLDLRNYHPVLDFDASADEEAVFSDVMPRNYAGGGVTLYVHFAATSATSGNAVWQAAFERIGDAQLDIDADSFASFNSSGTVAIPGTSGHVKICTIAFTDGAQMDSVAVGEGFRLKVRRDADGTSADDSATGDLELRFLELKET